MVKTAAVITHRRPLDTHAAIEKLLEIARPQRITLVFTPDEVAKHKIEPAPFIEFVPELRDDVDLCIVLGGDGTILTALRHYAGTGVPVFAVNYGEVGFLATLDPEGLGRDFDRAFAGEYEILQLPTIDVGRPQNL
jgi:NAD+ kinase